MARKQKDSPEGRSFVVRAESETALVPAISVMPVFPVPAEPPGAGPMEIEERTTRLSVNLKFLGLGRLTFDRVARFFRRRG